MHLRWGILGLGNIADKFCEDVQLVQNNSVYAVGSRSLDKANAFVKHHKAERAYGSYAELLEDPHVEIIYVATPHNSHHTYAIDALQAGKHVLCEKPIAVNSAQLKAIIDCAKENQRFLMEALWTRFNPCILEVKKKIDSGLIGEVRHIDAEFSMYRNDPDESRLLNPHLAGGALLDVGIYPVFLSYFLKGIPKKIRASSILHTTGVDLQTEISFDYENCDAHLIGGFHRASDMVAKIEGTKGRIYINKRWHEPDSYTLEKDGLRNIYHHSKVGRGYTHEIEECYAAIQNNQMESIHWSHQDSIQLIQVLDEIRSMTGIKYPFE